VLKQFHFHHPSEHTIDGKAYPLEMHFVHAAPDGDLAVVGVLFEEGRRKPQSRRDLGHGPGQGRGGTRDQHV